jgi:ergothioneine biosynthesis protein EgtB
MTSEMTGPARSTTTARDHELDRGELLARYRWVRETTERLCGPLETEDYVVQSMPDASPVKWHLAHTSWFFETFVLKPAAQGRAIAPAEYAYLFNSYYNALGERIARSKRGLLSRPTVAEVYHYRARVDEAVGALLQTADGVSFSEVAPFLVLGLNHEQQHQELILTDLKYLFGSNPVRPAYREWVPTPSAEAPPVRWLSCPGGLGEIGHGGEGFAFDNESPRHRVYNGPYRLASRLVTNGEYLGFIEDGGYDRPEFWLSDGWNARQAQGWAAPLYWEKTPGGWRVMTLAGEHALVAGEPVCHVSYYEADAFARWAGARLPSEAEWERAAEDVPVLGNFLESEQYHPRPLPPGASADSHSPLQLFGDVWEWTGSPYVPYPGFQPAAGALGEYNGKFMCNQMVLRGGSCATPRSHLRATYRNFFPPDARWQFSGVRLAQDG